MAKKITIGEIGRKKVIIGKSGNALYFEVDGFRRFGNVTTSERNAIVPKVGDSIYNTTVNAPQYHDGTTWVTLNPA